MIAEQKDELEREKEEWAKQTSELKAKSLALEKQLEEKAQEEKSNPELSSELTRLQLSYFKEKKDMMSRQKGLEKMLNDALEDKVGGDKENSAKKRPPKSSKKLTLDKMIKRSRELSSPRIPPKIATRQPLSPTGSVVSRLPLSPQGSVMSNSSHRSRIPVDP